MANVLPFPDRQGGKRKKVRTSERKQSPAKWRQEFLAAIRELPEDHPLRQGSKQ